MIRMLLVIVAIATVPALTFGAIGYHLGRRRGWLQGYRHRVTQEERALTGGLRHVVPMRSARRR